MFFRMWAEHVKDIKASIALGKSIQEENRGLTARERLDILMKFEEMKEIKARSKLRGLIIAVISFTPFIFILLFVTILQKSWNDDANPVFGGYRVPDQIFVPALLIALLSWIVIGSEFSMRIFRRRLIAAKPETSSDHG